MKKLILFLVLGVLLSCQSTDNRRLEKTLDLAQSNRGELEKVIQYYSQNEADSLKLKAAQFLILLLAETMKIIVKHRRKLFSPKPQ